MSLCVTIFYLSLLLSFYASCLHFSRVKQQKLHATLYIFLINLQQQTCVCVWSNLYDIMLQLAGKHQSCPKQLHSRWKEMLSENSNNLLASNLPYLGPLRSNYPITSILCLTCSRKHNRHGKQTPSEPYLTTL